MLLGQAIKAAAIAATVGLIVMTSVFASRSSDAVVPPIAPDQDAFRGLRFRNVAAYRCPPRAVRTPRVFKACLQKNADSTAATFERLPHLPTARHRPRR